MAKMRVLFLLAGAALLLLTTTATANGGDGCSFSGIVRLDDAPVATGTRITAVAEGNEYYTHTPPGLGASSHFITILPPEGKSYPDGAKVTFKIDSYTAEQTGIFQTGASQRVDLTAYTGAKPAGGSSAAQTSSVKVWIVAGIGLALLAISGTAYYVLMVLPIIRRRIEAKKVTPPPAWESEESQEQPNPRYVWDPKKLAWVENHKLPEAASLEEAPQVIDVQKAPVGRKKATEQPATAESNVAKHPRRDL